MSCCIRDLPPQSDEGIDVSSIDISKGTKIGVFRGYEIYCRVPDKKTACCIAACTITAVVLFTVGGIFSAKPRSSIWLSKGLFFPATVLMIKALYDVATGCFSLSKIPPVVDDRRLLYEEL